MPVWVFWRTEKSFVPTRIWTPSHPESGTDVILTMLPQPQNFTPEQAMKAWPWQVYLLERNLIPTVQETGWAPGSVWSDAINLVPTMGFNPQTLQSIASRYTHYTDLANKTLIRYTEHIRYTRSNHPQVAFAVQVLNNCHEYGLDEIQQAKPFTKRTKDECLWKFLCAVT